MQVLLTGASGRVGTAVLEHLGDEHEFTALDREAHPDYPTTVADVTDAEAVRTAVEGHDAVVHLAGAPEVDADWERVLRNNLVGAYTVFDAAADADVEHVVFASSNHVVGLYEEEHAPALYFDEVDLLLDETVPVRPDSLYGTSKVFGEALGRYYVETGGIDGCHALRIGSVREPAYDHPYGDAERGVETGRWERDSAAYAREVARMKATWQSRRDLAHQVDCSLDHAGEGFDVFYGVSDNATRWFDLEHARDVLGYAPRDDGTDWDGPPTE